MRKLLLVTLIGMVLAMDLYGFITELISNYESKQVEESHTSYTIVYTE